MYLVDAAIASGDVDAEVALLCECPRCPGPRRVYDFFHAVDVFYSHINAYGLERWTGYGPRHETCLTLCCAPAARVPDNWVMSPGIECQVVSCSESVLNTHFHFTYTPQLAPRVLLPAFVYDVADEFC